MTCLPTIFRQFANLTTFLSDPPTISNFFDDIFDWISDWIFRQFPTGFADFPEHLRTDIMRILKTLTRVSCGFWTLLDGYHADFEYSFAHIMRILNTLLRILCGFWILFCGYYADFEYSFAHIMGILNTLLRILCGFWIVFEYSFADVMRILKTAGSPAAELGGHESLYLPLLGRPAGTRRLPRTQPHTRGRHPTGLPLPSIRAADVLVWHLVVFRANESTKLIKFRPGVLHT